MKLKFCIQPGYEYNKPMSSTAHDLLVRGMAAARTKEYPEARKLLEWALTANPDTEQKITIWWWLSEISQDPAEQRMYVEDILAHDINDARARRKLAILNGKIKPSQVIDPDRLVRPPSELRPASADRFTCPKCGGRMVYTPDGQALICEYCQEHDHLLKGSTGQVGVLEQDFVAAMSIAGGHLQPVNMRTFNCQGCGVSFILPAEKMTLTCPYCAATYVVENAEAHPMLPPSAVIPFSVTEVEAKKALKDWLLQNESGLPKRVAPGAAIFLPVWTFDLGGSIGWRCQKYSNRKWVPINGEVPILHLDVPVAATRRLSRSFLDVLDGFSYGKSVAYDERFLANWTAETYQVPMGDAALHARQAVLSKEKPRIQGSIDGQVREITLLTAEMFVQSYKLVLVPAWLTHYYIGDERFDVLINGQTGQVHIEKTPAMPAPTGLQVNP